MPSTATSIDRSIMSRASRAMQSACCWHGSGNPLTAMYLSPTVSTWRSNRLGHFENCVQTRQNRRDTPCKYLRFYEDLWARRMSCRERWASAPFFQHKKKQTKENKSKRLSNEQWKLQFSSLPGSRNCEHKVPCWQYNKNVNNNFFQIDLLIVFFTWNRRFRWIGASPFRNVGRRLVVRDVIHWPPSEAAPNTTICVTDQFTISYSNIQ